MDARRSQFVSKKPMQSRMVRGNGRQRERQCKAEEGAKAEDLNTIASKEKTSTTAGEEQSEQESKRKRDIERKMERDRNLAVLGRDEGDVGAGRGGHGLDSSLKKCSAFIRKLKNGVTEENVRGLVNECEGLNLSRYVSEVVTAILEGKLKPSEVDAIAKLCGVIHRRYPDFKEMIVPGLMKGAVGEGGGDGGLGLGVRKTSLRVLNELVVLGVADDASGLLSVVKKLTGGRKMEEKRNDIVSDVVVVASWLKGSAAAFVESKGDGWEAQVIKKEDKQILMRIIDAWYDVIVVGLVEKCYAEFKEAEAANVHARQTKGLIGEELMLEFERLRKTYERVEGAAVAVASILGKEFQPKKLTFEDDSKGDIKEEEELGEVWETEEEAEFYTKLPILPGTKQAREAARRLEQRQVQHEVKKKDSSSPGTARSSTSSKHSLHKTSGEGNVRGSVRASGIRGKRRAGPGSASGATSPKPISSAGTHRENKVNSGASLSSKSAIATPTAKEALCSISPEPFFPIPSLDSLLSRLGTTGTHLACDRFVATFLVVARSNRTAQKRLIKSLFTVSPLKTSVLPFYSRIAASLLALHTDVPQTLAQSLVDEFGVLLRQKTPDDALLQRRVKNARFIGELVKFKVITPSTVFELLNTCIDNFSSFTVDVACHLLETCGKFLYRTRATHVRMSNILGIVWRLKSVKNLEARHNALIETVYFAIKPPTSTRLREQAPRSPQHEFIRHLLYRTLSTHNAPQIVKVLAKLRWNNKETQDFVVERLVAVDDMRFSTLDAVASVVLGLAKLHEAIGIAVIDLLLESVRQGIERSDPRECQRRIAEVALLSSLHITGLVPNNLMFETLYDLVDAGYECSGWFTVRAICVILARCGPHWGSSKTGRSGTVADIERRRKKVFWAIFEKSVYDKKEQEAHLVGLALGTSLNDNRSVSSSAALNGADSHRLTRSNSSGTPTGKEIGSVPLGVQHVLEEAWQGIRENGWSRAVDYESAVKAVTRIYESEERQFICRAQRQVESPKKYEAALLNVSIEESEEEVEDVEDEAEEELSTEDSIDTEVSYSEATSPSDSEDDDGLILTAPARRVRTEEEVAFERELAALRAESVASARSAAAFSGRNLRGMAMPIGLLAKHSAAVDSPDDKSDQGDPTVVPFQMLVRKGAKSAVKGLEVPIDSSIAAAARESEVVGKAESAEVRRLVLESRTIVESDEDRKQSDARKEQHEKEILTALFKPERHGFG